MGLLRSTMQRLGVAVALIYALPLAGLSTSYAAQPNAAETSHVNGQTCGDLCKAYMAWSDRMMARFRPSQPQIPAVVPHKKPGRTIHPASAARQLDLSSFAQLRRGIEAAPRSPETPHVQAAPTEPVEPISERLFPADGVVTATPADAGAATNEPAESTLVSVGRLVFDPDISSTSRFARGDGLFAFALGLALCALFSLLAWVGFRRWTQTANTIR